MQWEIEILPLYRLLNILKLVYGDSGMGNSAWISEFSFITSYIWYDLSSPEGKDKFLAIESAFYVLHRCLIEDCVAANSDTLAWWKQSEFAVQDILFDTVSQNL